jgi:hypothetical protein
LPSFWRPKAGCFFGGFSKQLTSLESAVTETKERITAELKELSASVLLIESEIKESLDEIGTSASNAENNAEQAHGLSEEAMHLMDQIHAMVEELAVGDPELDSITIKTGRLLEKFAIGDPAIARDRRAIKAMARALAQRSREKELPDDRKWIASTLQQIFSQIERKVVARWVKEGLEESGTQGELANLSPRYTGLLQMVIENEVQKRQTKIGKSRRRIVK